MRYAMEYIWAFLNTMLLTLGNALPSSNARRAISGLMMIIIGGVIIVIIAIVIYFFIISPSPSVTTTIPRS